MKDTTGFITGCGDGCTDGFGEGCSNSAGVEG